MTIVIAMINQTVLPFKLEETKDMITAHAGLALLWEFSVGFGLLKALDKNLPAVFAEADLGD